MQKLNEIIKSLDGKAVTSYSKLVGIYERNKIIYRIVSVSGAQYKYARVDIEIDKDALIKDLTFTEQDKTAVSAFIMRELSAAAHMANNEMQMSESNVQKGAFIPYRFGTRVLQSSIVKISELKICMSLTVKLPYNNSAYNNGSRATQFDKAQSGSALAMSQAMQKESLDKRKKGVISQKALKLLLTKNLTRLAEDFVSGFDASLLKDAISLYKDQQFVRNYLKKWGYVSFIANGSVITRKGKTDIKDSLGAIPFKSPESLEIEIKLPSGKTVRGMGIKRGITIITGDAYHGKSTILDAIREGIYDHVSGDGREYVITDSSAMAIRSEDGRNIRNTDISFFLGKLPNNKIDPKHFFTDNASGSTSQASGVAEAMESGCVLMLFDEDRCANNFMYKDEKMKTVIKNASTVPFIDNAQMIFDKFGISSIIVVGASGEYFRVADRVILVDGFLPSEYVDYKKAEQPVKIPFSPTPRSADLSFLGKTALRREIEIKAPSSVKIGGEEIDVSDIVTHVTAGQLDFISSFIYYITVMERNSVCNLYKSVLSLYDKIATQGAEFIHQLGLRGSSGVIEYVRPQDMMAVLYRLKCVEFPKK